jgi:hypothetical protein
MLMQKNRERVYQGFTDEVKKLCMLCIPFLLTAASFLWAALVATGAAALRFLPASVSPSSSVIPEGRIYFDTTAAGSSNPAEFHCAALLLIAALVSVLLLLLLLLLPVVKPPRSTLHKNTRILDAIRSYEWETTRETRSNGPTRKQLRGWLPMLH